MNRLPVIDGGKVVGILSNRDIRLFLGVPYFSKKDHYEKLDWIEKSKDRLAKTKVKDIMSTPVKTCTKNDSIVAAAKLMRIGVVNSLVVTESEESNVAVGIITRSDLIDQIIRLYEK